MIHSANEANTGLSKTSVIATSRPCAWRKRAINCTASKVMFSLSSKKFAAQPGFTRNTTCPDLRHHHLNFSFRRLIPVLRERIFLGGW